MKDIVELIVRYIGEYFAFMFAAIGRGKSWFGTVDVERTERSGAKSFVKTVDARLIIFSVVNLIVGATLLNTIVRQDLTDLTQYVVISLILWVIWGVLLYAISFFLGVRIVHFFDSLSISLQVFGAVFVLSSLTTVILSAILDHPFDIKLGVYFLVQLILLFAYMMRSLIDNYDYRYLVQPVIVSIISTAVCVYLNIRTFSRLDLPFPARPPETENIALIDLASIPPDKTAFDLLHGIKTKEISLICLVSDTPLYIATDSKFTAADSLLKRTRYSKGQKIIAIDTVITRTVIPGTIHVLSDFNRKWAYAYNPIYCDTLFVHYNLNDSLSTHADINPLHKENEIRLQLRDIFYYRKFRFEMYSP